MHPFSSVVKSGLDDCARLTTVGDEDVITAALERLDAAYVEAAEAVSALEPRASFEAASSLSDRLQDLASRVAHLRAQCVTRIADTERLTLAKLAKSIGVSKARAGQWVLAARGKTGQQTRGL